MVAADAGLVCNQGTLYSTRTSLTQGATFTLYEKVGRQIDWIKPKTSLTPSRSTQQEICISKDHYASKTNSVTN